MLLDWIAYLREGRRAGAKLAQANPKMVEGYQALSAGQNGNGALDAMGTAVALNAGAAYSYAMRTMEAFDQFGAKDAAGTPAS